MRKKEDHVACKAALNAVGDAMYAIGGKWRLRIILALSENGDMRFNELQRTITGISAKVLSTELKELEMNGFIKRKIDTGTPVVVEYQLTPYSDTLDDVLQALTIWGMKHRKKIMQKA